MNPVLVDTSIWIEFFRGRPEPIKALVDLLDDDLVATVAPIKLELLMGARREERSSIDSAFNGLNWYPIKEENWTLIESWLKGYRASGRTFGLVDLLIAATAKINRLAIWTSDKDFSPLFETGLIERWG